jgi:hypothetical protein
LNKTSPSSSPIQSDSVNQHDLTWSRSEKAIARKAFDAALKRELHEVIQEAKQMASRIQRPSDLSSFSGNFSAKPGCERKSYAACARTS